MTLRLDVLPATAWAETLEEPEGPDCPATWLRRHPALRVVADEPAASALRGRT